MIQKEISMATQEEKRYVSYFSSDEKQINFEFWFLIIYMLLLTALLLFVYVWNIDFLDIKKKYFYSVLGASFGGWAFDAKWFYRVTAKGKDLQYKQGWESNKFYWRILTPFLSGIVGFAFYIIVISKVIPFISIDSNSNITAFGFSFIFGYFSDMTIGKMSDWVCKILGQTKKPDTAPNKVENKIGQNSNIKDDSEEDDK